MHRLAAILVVTLALAAPRVAAADRAGPALDLTFGIALPPGLEASGGMFTRAGAGLQVGRVAGLVHGELFALEPEDPTLDSESLRGSGVGGSMRIELAQSRQYFIQFQAGINYRRLEGNGEVRRACDVFGTCAAGFYLETPDYRDTAPYVAIAMGVRGKGRIWPGFGGQLGIGKMSVDRPGTGPDANGAIIWLAAQFVIGSD